MFRKVLWRPLEKIQGRATGEQSLSKASSQVVGNNTKTTPKEKHNKTTTEAFHSSTSSSSQDDAQEYLSFMLREVKRTVHSTTVTAVHVL